MVGAFIVQGSEEMYRFNIKEISKEDALNMTYRESFRVWIQKTIWRLDECV